MRVVLLVLPVALSLGGCIASTEPLMGRDSRALPFLSGAKFDRYTRDDPGKPWANRERIQFVADNELVVTEVASSGKRTSFNVTLHPIAPRRFLAQMAIDIHSVRYRYGVLEIANGEGILNYFHCNEIDQEAFRAKGGTVGPEPRYDVQLCTLDGAPNPLELLQSVMNQPPRGQARYVPVQ